MQSHSSLEINFILHPAQWHGRKTVLAYGGAIQSCHAQKKTLAHNALLNDYFLKVELMKDI